MIILILEAKFANSHPSNTGVLSIPHEFDDLRRVSMRILRIANFGCNLLSLIGLTVRNLLGNFANSDPPSTNSLGAHAGCVETA